MRKNDLQNQHLVERDLFHRQSDGITLQVQIFDTVFHYKSSYFDSVFCALSFHQVNHV